VEPDTNVELISTSNPLALPRTVHRNSTMEFKPQTTQQRRGVTEPAPETAL
jgi:hypothetical protein